MHLRVGKEFSNWGIIDMFRQRELRTNRALLCGQMEGLERRDLLACDVHRLPEVAPPEVEADLGLFADVALTAAFGEVEAPITTGSRISMGTIPWTQQSELQIIVTNNSGQDIKVTRLLTPNGFRIPEGIDRVIGAGESADATILYDSWSPADCGALQIRLEANDGDDSRLLSMDLNARHPNAEATVLYRGAEISTDNMPVIEFGDVAPDADATETLTVRNDGDLSLYLSSISASSKFATAASGKIVVVPPQESTELPISLSAASPGDHIGTFQFGTNDLDDFSFTFDLLARVTGDPVDPAFGDFDNDGSVDVEDLELLQAAVAAANVDLIYDLDGDGGVSSGDIEWMVNDVLNLLPGDADLNGTVEFPDFLALSGNFGKRDVFWRGGDFDGDNEVSFTDFLQLSRNFGRSTS